MLHPVRIYFVRHGEVHNPERICYGRRAGFHLNENGRAQAKAVGEALHDTELAAIYCSPMPRAVETAEEILPFHDGLQITISDLINEVYTPYEGRPLSELLDSNCDFYTGTNPPYEQPSDILERVSEFIEGVREVHPDESIAAVTHGDVITFLVLWATGRPASLEERMVMYRSSVSKGSITLLTYRTDAPDEVPEVEHLMSREEGTDEI